MSKLPPGLRRTQFFVGSYNDMREWLDKIRKIEHRRSESDTAEYLLRLFMEHETEFFAIIYADRAQEARDRLEQKQDDDAL